MAHTALLPIRIEELFGTRRVPYPVERHLIACDLIACCVHDSCMASRSRGWMRVETLHLAVNYQSTL